MSRADPAATRADPAATRADLAGREDLLEFLRSHPIVTLASVSLTGEPQAAAVGVVVTDAFEIVFDTLKSTRKYRNVTSNPSVAFVFGGTGPNEARTAQYEGVADVPSGGELDQLQRMYLERFPDGRERLSLPGIVHVRVRPRWVRYSDYTTVPPTIVDFDFPEPNP